MDDKHWESYCHLEEQVLNLQAENKRLKEEARWIPVCEKSPPCFKYLSTYHSKYNPPFVVVVETETKSKNEYDYTHWKLIIWKE